MIYPHVRFPVMCVYAGILRAHVSPGPQPDRNPSNACMTQSDALRRCVGPRGDGYSSAAAMSPVRFPLTTASIAIRAL